MHVGHRPPQPVNVTRSCSEDEATRSAEERRHEALESSDHSDHKLQFANRPFIELGGVCDVGDYTDRIGHGLRPRHRAGVERNGGRVKSLSPAGGPDVLQVVLCRRDRQLADFTLHVGQLRAGRFAAEQEADQ